MEKMAQKVEKIGKPKKGKKYLRTVALQWQTDEKNWDIRKIEQKWETEKGYKVMTKIKKNRERIG